MRVAATWPVFIVRVTFVITLSSFGKYFALSSAPVT